MEINKIYCGDCLEIMQNIPDQSIDMILTDLPYGNKSICKWDKRLPFDKLWEAYTRIIKNSSAIVLTAKQPFTSYLILSNIKMFKYCWTWNKNSAGGYVNAHNRPLTTIEDIVVFSKGSCTNGAKNRMNYYPQGLLPYGKITRRGNRKDKENTYYRNNGNVSFQEFTNYPRDYLEFSYQKMAKHPTQKPVELFAYLLKTYTQKGDLVLDNCAGSCTTAIAALQTERNWICIEKEEKYCKIGEERIKNFH